MSESRSPFDRKHQITIEVDEAALTGVTDETLALWWHVAQHNPADGFANQEPGEITAMVGWEIIRRWLQGAPVAMHHHQQRHYFWKIASGLGNWRGPGRSFVPHEPLADPKTVMRALALGASKAREIGDTAEAERYEHLLRQLEEQQKEAGRG